MTVKQLKELLRDMPDDLQVLVLADRKHTIARHTENAKGVFVGWKNYNYYVFPLAEGEKPDALLID